MMKKLGARLLSAVMALSMLCGLLPAGALAADVDSDGTNTYTYASADMANETEALYTVTVKTSDEMENGSLTVIDQPDKTAEVTAVLEQKYDGELSPSVIDFSLQNEASNEITVPRNAEITVDFLIVSILGDPLFFQYENGTVRKLDVKKVASTDPRTAAFMSHYIMNVTSLENIVLLPTNSGAVTPKPEEPESYTQTYVSSDTMWAMEVTAASSLPEGTLSYTVNSSQNGDKELAQKVTTLLEKKYDGTIDPSVYEFTLTDSEGNAITLPEGSKITAKYKAPVLFADKILTFQYTGASVQKAELTKEEIENDTIQCYLCFEMDKLNDVAVLMDTGSFTPKKFSDMEKGRYYVTANLYVKGENNVVLPGITAYLTNPNLPS